MAHRDRVAEHGAPEFVRAFLYGKIIVVITIAVDPYELILVERSPCPYGVGTMLIMIRQIGHPQGEPEIGQEQAVGEHDERAACQCQDDVFQHAGVRSSHQEAAAYDEEPEDHGPGEIRGHDVMEIDDVAAIELAGPR